ncbi:uncharacterized protein LOC141674971 [Apium graveolens]|uniref:uncharacterized protein LOC141674971 n=1 Tax=Apium graveolens TaxID=4045 RepID=UPI003D7B4436
MTVEETLGSLKAHEERLRGQVETSGSQLLLIEEEWAKREREEGKILMTREEWLKRTTKGGTDMSSGQMYRYNKEAGRGGRKKFDKSRVRCFNCQGHGYYGAECKKSRREREHKEVVNITQMQDEESALLIAERIKENDNKALLINEENVSPKLRQNSEGMQMSSNMWYLDNGANNHMTRQLSKFRELDEGVKGKVKKSMNRLYKIIVESRSSECLLTKSDENAWLWHARLGHVKFNALKMMILVY